MEIDSAHAAEEAIFHAELDRIATEEHFYISNSHGSASEVTARTIAPGDYYTHRFSGLYPRAALLLERFSPPRSRRKIMRRKYRRKNGVAASSSSSDCSSAPLLMNSQGRRASETMERELHQRGAEIFEALADETDRLLNCSLENSEHEDVDQLTPITRSPLKSSLKKPSSSRKATKVEFVISPPSTASSEDEFSATVPLIPCDSKLPSDNQGLTAQERFKRKVSQFPVLSLKYHQDCNTIDALLSPTAKPPEGFRWDLVPKLSYASRVSSLPEFFLGDDSLVLAFQPSAQGKSMDDSISPKMVMLDSEQQPQHASQDFPRNPLRSPLVPPVIVLQPPAEDSPIKTSKKRSQTEPYSEEALLCRRRKGSHVPLSEHTSAVPTEPDEAEGLADHDLSEMKSHRFDQRQAQPRHSAAGESQRTKDMFDTDGLRRSVSLRENGRALHPPGSSKKVKKSIDHTPHELFVELDELSEFGGEMEWKETARWIKYEEDVEIGSDKWGKPHVAYLSFHSLLELRRGIEMGSVLLDLRQKDLYAVASQIVENLHITDQLRAEHKALVLRILLLRHWHLGEKRPSLRKQSAFSTLQKFGLETARISVPAVGGWSPQNAQHKETVVDMNGDAHHVTLQRPLGEENRKLSQWFSRSESRTDLALMKRIPEGTESMLVQVGTVNFLERPVMAFVRLAGPVEMPQITEIPVPIRFFFLLLGPRVSALSIEYREIGRAVGTLMSNKRFHNAAYEATDRTDLLKALTEFLDESIVLPPGEWDQKELLPVEEIRKKSVMLRQRRNALTTKDQKQLMKTLSSLREEKLRALGDPFERTGRPFGGLIKELHVRLKCYKSDFTDAKNWRCFTSILFIYFACCAPAVTFGGLFSKKTDGLLGMKSTLVATGFGGLVFALFSAQPLMLLGATGPVLIFEESLHGFSKALKLDLLPVRVWVGVWVLIFALLVVCFEGSFLVRFVTRFSEDIFSALVSVIFLTECWNFLSQMYEEHPVVALEHYCRPPANNTTTIRNSDNFNESSNQANYSGAGQQERSSAMQPNTALLSTVLMFGTFLIAWLMRRFRSSVFFGRRLRRALGDFGLSTSIVTMTAVDYFLLHDSSFTQKLDVSSGWRTGEGPNATWIVPPLGIRHDLPPWLPLAAGLPGLLLFMIIFVEIEITQMQLSKKQNALVKGTGFHWDLLLACFLVLCSSLFGLPWLCAATVRSMAHLSSLTKFSDTHAPGQKPLVVGVIEQRVTPLIIHLLIALTIFAGAVLECIPIAVLLGVFLYFGMMNMVGVQLWDRLILFFTPVKYHPSVAYSLRVRTWRMHLYTIVQLLFLGFVWTVKSVRVTSFLFPMALMLAVVARKWLLPMMFSTMELLALDGDPEDVEEEEADFYEECRLPV